MKRGGGGEGAQKEKKDEEDCNDNSCPSKNYDLN